MVTVAGIPFDQETSRPGRVGEDGAPSIFRSANVANPGEQGGFS